MVPDRAPDDILMKRAQALGTGPRRQGWVLWKPAVPAPTLSEPPVIRTRGRGTASEWATLSPKGQSPPGWWWPAAPRSRADGRGFYHQHPGRQLRGPPCRGLFRGRQEECGRSARPSASLQCQRKVLSSRPWSLMAGPALPGQALSSASPSPASLSIWVPPWAQEEEAGRQGRRFWNPAVCQLCDLALAAAHSGP